MKREDVRKILPDIGDEQLNQLMDLHGTDITAKNTIINEQKERLDKYGNADPGSLQAQVDSLTKQLRDANEKHARELRDRDFDAALSAAIAKKKGRSSKAIRALLDVDSLKQSKDTEKDIGAALDALEKSDSYLFEAAASSAPFSAGTGTGAAKSDPMAAFRSAAGITT